MDDYKQTFIDIYNSKITREGSKELITWIMGTDFFTSPASTKYHGAKEGGLVEHSVKVYQVFRRVFLHMHRSQTWLRPVLL